MPCLSRSSFPAPYDVGEIDLETARLSVKGSIDLTQAFPVVEPSARLSGDLLTGVSNGGVLPSRGVRFDKEAFATALEGQIGRCPLCGLGKAERRWSTTLCRSRYDERVHRAIVAPQNKHRPGAHRAPGLQYSLVETKGLEPSTPGLQSRCSPN